MKNFSGAKDFVSLAMTHYKNRGKKMKIIKFLLSMIPVSILLAVLFLNPTAVLIALIISLISSWMVGDMLMDAYKTIKKEKRDK